MSDMVESALASREMGQIPISIGSSLALEGAFGILEDHPNHDPAIFKVDVLYVNLRTLLRNIAGSVESEVNAQLSSGLMARTLENEVQILISAVQQFTQGKVDVVPYYCTYESVERKFPHAMHKTLNTSRQKFAHQREVNALADFEESQGWMVSRKFDIDFDQDNRRGLIMTSYALDLLQRYRFTTLSLLESHTGTVKVPAQWYTKLTNGKEMTKIPFDRMTIQLFGDGSNMFSGFPIKIKKHMLGLADKYRWTPMTTSTYIKDCVKRERDPVLEALIRNLYGSA